MQTMADEWIKEGKVIGRQEGRQEALRAITLRVLRRRFASSEVQMQQIEQQLTRITDEIVLNGLADSALDVLVLPDFMSRLYEVVPTAT